MKILGKNKGAVALVALVLISVISLSFVISAAVKSLDELSMGARASSDSKVFNVIESCLEEVLLQIRRDSSYGVGSGTINFSIGDGSCSVDVSAVSSNRTLDLVSSSNCSAYDCEFVALVKRLGLDSYTSDKKVLKEFPEIASDLKSIKV